MTEETAMTTTETTPLPPEIEQAISDAIWQAYDGDANDRVLATDALRSAISRALSSPREDGEARLREGLRAEVASWREAARIREAQGGPDAVKHLVIESRGYARGLLAAAEHVDALLAASPPPADPGARALLREVYALHVSDAGDEREHAIGCACLWCRVRRAAEPERAAPAPDAHTETAGEPYVACTACGGSGKEGTGTPSAEGGEDYRECWQCGGTGSQHTETPAPSPSDESRPTPTHRCKACGALWREWGNLTAPTWTLVLGRAGACCDNAPMREQMEEITNFRWHERHSDAAQNEVEARAAGESPSDESPTSKER